jgi:cell division septation protein DedD
MEKQKIFWVILSVTVFVVVVLVVGLFLLKQDPAGLAVAPAATEPPADTSTGIYEFSRDVSSAEGDTEVLRFVIGGGEAGAPAAGSASAPAAPESGAAPSAPALPSTSSAAVKPAAPAAKPAASTAAKPAAAAPAAKPTATARGPEYWIQTGSYKSQTRAEELSQTLTAKGLAGRVFSFAKANETFFRVRIGPYTNKQEAEKFLAIIKTIQGLEASYISLVPGTRSLN